MLRCAGVLLVCCAACSSAPGPSSAGDAAPPAPDASADAAAPPADAGISDAPPDAPDPCASIPNVTYQTTTVTPETMSPETQGDVNLLLRKWRPAAGQAAALVDINGPTDTNAPRLYTLFTDDRDPVFSGVYQVQAWDWGCNCATDYMTDPAVTMAGFAMQPAEVVELPMDGYDIGGGMQAMVLYATTETITLKYTHEDDVVKGYTIHMANLCVEPTLLALYQQSNAAGRTSLPVLAGNQPIGRVRGTELLVTIRDTGSWMDPRSRKDWYQH
jgi:hypothetical protein